MSYLIPIGILLSSSAGLVIVTGNAARFTPDFIENIIPTFNNQDMLDPFAGKAEGSASFIWKTDGTSGLEVELLNALNPSWDVFFNVAVADWDFGNPDAVTLSSKKIEEEKDCTPVDGKIKVCNGDYGDTKWRGINESVFDDAGFIVASTVRLNSYYLDYDGDDAKQYTMCHEIGHSLGLPHTDETFGNPDLGNCLDYTENFKVNEHPDVSNYESLLAFYGPVGGRRLRRTPTPLDFQLAPSIYHEIREEVDKLIYKLDEDASKDGWTLLHRTKHGQEQELILNSGHRVRLSTLFA